MINTYCYQHGLVEGGCLTCELAVWRMLSGRYPYRKGIPIVDAYSSYFPQVRSADR